MPSARIEFTGSLGHPLAGRLDTPDGSPRAWAVFAHCFTCSKDTRAAAYIARALAEALVKLYKENANTLTPDPVYSAFHDSHPPASARVSHLLSKVAT